MNIRLTLLCSLLAAGTVAHAEGFYVLGSAGQTKTHLKDLSRNDIDVFVEDNAQEFVNSSKIEDTDTGYKLQLGYQFSTNFALEGGYVDLGKIKYKSSLEDGTSENLSYTTKGWNIDGVLILPVTDGVYVLGKLGLMRAETKFKATDFDSHTTNATAPIAGIGIGWNFFKGLSVRAEWERYFDLNKNKTEYDEFGDVVQQDSKIDVDLLSIGLSYQF